MNESDLVSEIEHLSEQLGKELYSRAYLEEQLKEAEGIFEIMLSAIFQYRKKYNGGKRNENSENI